MSGLIAVALVAIGTVLAFAGAELCARALRSVGRGAFAGVGAVAGGLAATAPEVLFGVRASWDGAPDLAVGLAAGSLIANALLAAVIAASGAREPADRATKALAIWTALGVGAFLFAAADGLVNVFEGAVLVLGAVIAAVLTASRRGEDAAGPRQPVWMSLTGLLAGATLLLFGAVLAVDAAVERPLGIGGLLVVGLVVFGLAAALPEIAAAGFAARHGRGRTALANVVAGMAMTAFGVVGAAALVAPVPIEPVFMRGAAPLMVASVAGTALLALAGGRLPRWAPVGGAVVYGALIAFTLLHVR